MPGDDRERLEGGVEKERPVHDRLKIPLFLMVVKNGEEGAGNAHLEMSAKCRVARDQL